MLIAAQWCRASAPVAYPQTLSTITRIFPAHRRGVALGAWGTVASVSPAQLGPLAGGAGRQHGVKWIFFVNVPVGVIGLIGGLSDSALPHHPHQFIGGSASDCRVRECF